MNLPTIIKQLIKAQDDFDSENYARCFTENAIVIDEGKIYTGRNEIKEWIDHANKTYRVIMKPLSFSSELNVLSAEISGNFPGSPLEIKYHYTFKNDLIHSLKII